MSSHHATEKHSSAEHSHHEGGGSSWRGILIKGIASLLCGALLLTCAGYIQIENGFIPQRSFNGTSLPTKDKLVQISGSRDIDSVYGLRFRDDNSV